MKLTTFLITLILVDTLLVFIPGTGTETAQADELEQAKTQDLFTKLYSHTTWTMEYNDSKDWKDTSGNFHITYTDRANHPEKKKFTTWFMSPEPGIYRQTLVIKDIVSLMDMSQQNYFYFEFKDFGAFLNYSDIAYNDAINIEHKYDKDSNIFTFTITTKESMTKNKFLSLDPEYTVADRTGLTQFSLYQCYNRKLARSENGTLYTVVYNGTGPLGNYQVTCFRSCDNGTTWKKFSELSKACENTAGGAAYQSLAIDSQNNLHIVWSCLISTKQVIRYVRFDDTAQSFTSPVNISYSDSGTNVPYGPAIAIDSSDNIFVACTVNDNIMTKSRIAYTKSTDSGTTWSAWVNVSDQYNVWDQDFSTIAIDGNNNVFFGWYGKNAAGTVVVKLREYYASNTTLHTRVINITTNTISHSVSLATDSNNYVHCTWTESNQIHYRIYNTVNRSFTGNQQLTVTMCYNPCISLDRYDQPYIVWKELWAALGYVVNYTYYNINTNTWYPKMRVSSASGADTMSSPCSMWARWPVWSIVQNETIRSYPVRGISVIYYNETTNLVRYYNINITWMFKTYLPYVVAFANYTQSGTQPSPTQRKVCISSNGTLYAVVTEQGGIAAEQGVRMCRSLDNGYTWQILKKCISASYFDCCLAIDSEDTVHWAFTTNGGFNIYYRNFTYGTTWTDIVNITKKSHDHEDTMLVVNKSDTVWCFWYAETAVFTTSYQIQYSKLYNGAWTKPVNVTNEADYRHTFMTAAVDSNDVIHLAYDLYDDPSPPYFYHIQYMTIQPDGTQSSPINITTRNGANNLRPCIVVDSNNVVHMDWNGQYNGSVNEYEIRYSNSTNWHNIVNVTRTRQEQTSPSICIDQNNNLAIYWAGELNASGGKWVLRYSSQSSGIWSQPINITYQFANREIWYPSALYSSYPIVDTNGIMTKSQIPTSGSCVIFTNKSQTSTPSGRINYYDNSVILTAAGPTCPTYSFNATNVNTTRATLHSLIYKNTTGNCEAGFYISKNSTVNRLHYLLNVSAGDGYSSGTRKNIWYNITNLDPSTYYYIRPWIRNNSQFLVSLTTNYSYLLTAPLNATAGEVKNVGSQSAWLKWYNPNIYDDDGTIRAVCRYNTGSFPTSPLTGTAGFNTSTTENTYGHGNITGLTAGRTYYFSIFLYMNCSGSPLMHSWSTSYEGIIGNTSGGQYNISIKYENASYHVPKLVSKTNYSLIVYYHNRTETNIFDYSGHCYLQESTGDFGRFRSGKAYIQLNLSFTPMFFEFNWNTTNISTQIQTISESYTSFDPDTSNITSHNIQLAYTPLDKASVHVQLLNTVTSAEGPLNFFLLSGDIITLEAYSMAMQYDRVIVNYSYNVPVTASKLRCTRYHIPANSEKNFTFYVLTDRLVYGESTANYNNSLVKFTYAFIDNSGLFSPSNGFNIYAYIYAYDSDGNRLVIDSQYLDTNSRVFPMLLFGKKYYMGISSSTNTYDQFTFAPTSEMTSNGALNTNPYLTVSGETGETTVGTFNYKFGQRSTTGNGIYFYFYNSLLDTTNASLKIYNWNGTKGTLISNNYTSLSTKNWTIHHVNANWTYLYTFLHTSNGATINQTGFIYQYEFSFNGSKINWAMNKTFGRSPFRIDADMTQYVTWVNVVVVIISFIILFQFPGPLSALSGFGVGGWLLFSGLTISGVSAIFLAVGGILMVLSFLQAYRESTT